MVKRDRNGWKKKRITILQFSLFLVSLCLSISWSGSCTLFLSCVSFVCVWVFFFGFFVHTFYIYRYKFSLPLSIVDIFFGRAILLKFFFCIFCWFLNSFGATFFAITSYAMSVCCVYLLNFDAVHFTIFLNLKRWTIIKKKSASQKSRRKKQQPKILKLDVYILSTICYFLSRFLSLLRFLSGFK